MIKKLELVLMNLQFDTEVLWVDNDIVFFDNCINDIRKYHGQFVMQDDGWSPCCGFFLVRKTPKSIHTLQTCIQWLRDRKENPYVNDQHAFLNVYKQVPRLLVTCLPRSEYPNGYVFFELKESRSPKMLHCNFVTGVVDKVQRLQDANLWNPTDEAFELVSKYQF
jgi:hypothetical protein